MVRRGCAVREVRGQKSLAGKGVADLVPSRTKTSGLVVVLRQDGCVSSLFLLGQTSETVARARYGQADLRPHFSRTSHSSIDNSV